MKAPETIQEKATRLLATGRLTVRSLTVATIVATIEGDHDTYTLGCNPGGWYCSCPTPTPRCSHIAALKQVILSPSRSPQDPNVKTFTNSTGRKEPRDG